MGDRADKALRGLQIQSDVFTLDNLAASGAGVLDSSFAQRAPRPGQSETTATGTRIEPAISGGQSIDVELQFRRAGMPELRGAEVLWKLPTETDDSAWRGWQPPNLQANWIAAVWDETDPFETFDLIVTQDDQQCILLFIETTTAEPIQAKVFDFAATDPVWGSAVTVSVDPYDNTGAPENVSDNVVAGVALPNGRILAMAEPLTGNAAYSMWASDDKGATWFRYAAPGDTGGINFTAGTEARWRLEFYRGDVVFFRETTSGRIEQWASGDLGASLGFVATTDAVGSSISVKAIPNSAGIVLAYIKDSNSFPTSRVITGAFSPYTDATEVEIDSVAITNMACAVDAVGNIWVFGTPTANPELIAVWVSEDNGLTYVRTDDLANTRDASTFLRNFAAVFVRGWACLAHTWTTDVTTAPIGSIGTLWAGGWSSFGSNTANELNFYRDRQTWAQLTGVTGHTGIPIELPDNMGWISIGAAVTLQSPGELQFLTTGAVNSTRTFDLTTGALVGLFEMYILTGTGGSAGQVAATAVMKHPSAGTDYQLDAYFDAGNSRIRFRDLFGAADVGDITGLDLSIPIQIVMFINLAGEFLTLYKRPWETRWQRGPEDAVTGLTDGGGANPVSRIRMGHSNSGTNTSRWRQYFGVNANFSDTEFGIGWEELEDFAGLQFGAPITNSPRPIPEVGSETAAAFLSAARGPAATAEIFTVAPVFDFGVDRIFTTLSPSPEEPFRTVDAASEVILAFDAVVDTTLGPSWQWAFTFLNTNWQTGVIERRTGGSWVAVGTHNAAIGFEGLSFTRNGDWIRPAAGTITAGRPIARNELVGSYVFSGAVTSKIIGNGPGIWSDPTGSTTLFPEIQLEDVSSMPASGTVTIVLKNSIMYVPHTTNLPTPHAPQWRLRIPVQANPDGYVQIGNFLGGSVAVFGKQWSRGWSRSMRPNTSRRVSRFGTIRKRKQGPPVRRWSMGWADGVNTGKIRGVASPDYLAQPGGTGTPLALRDDVWTLLYGLLEETGGAEVAVVAVAVVPEGTTSVNDRTLFLYGTWDSNVQANQVQGSEGIDAFFRMDPITVNENP